MNKEKPSDAMAPLTEDSPLLKAWKAWKRTDDFANIRRWALMEPHVDGSMWAAFMAGWKENERIVDAARSLVEAIECAGEANTYPDYHILRRLLQQRKASRDG